MTAQVPIAAPVTRHTRSVRILSAVFALVCVILSAVGLRLTDDPVPFHKVTGTVGQTLTIEGVQVSVIDVTVGQTLAGTDGGAVIRSPGVFVGVDLQIACPGKSYNPATRARLVAGSHTYQEWQGYGAITPSAGYQTVTRLIFEVDPGDLGRLVLDTDRLEVISGYQTHGWIDLGLAGRADQLRAEAPERAVTKANSDSEPIT